MDSRVRISSKIISIIFALAVVFTAVMAAVEGSMAGSRAVLAKNEPEEYVRFIATATDPIVYCNFTGNHDTIDPDKVRYAKIMYRTGTKTDSNGAELTGQFFISPAAQPCVPIKWNHSGEWETIIVDMTTVDAESGLTSLFNSENYTETYEIRFDPMECNKYDAKNKANRGTVNANSYIDVAWIAFFETKSDANAYTGTQNTPYCIIDTDELADSSQRSNVNVVRYPEASASKTNDGIPAHEGFAVLEITLNDGKQDDDITKEQPLAITYTLSYDGQVIENQTGTIKGRGNYTFTQSKKPYQVKCDEKTDWFGFGKAKKWILLANVTDQTHLRNQIAFYLASKFNFAFTPETRPAHLYINGNYMGLYLITEKVEINKNRLDIDDAGGDCLLEIDNNYGSSEKNKFKSPIGNLYVVKDPDDDDVSESRAENADAVSMSDILKNAKTKVSNFENAIKKGKSLEQIGQYMDVDSLVDWYIFNEIMKNDDTLFNSSIYLYNDYDGVLHMGPVWDYDLAMAGIDRYNNMNPTGLMFENDYWGRPNWFEYLLDREDFMSLVWARWTELYSQNVFGDMLETLDIYAEELEAEYDFDKSRWHNEGVFVGAKTYKKAVSALRTFIEERVSWLNSQWNKTNATPNPATRVPTAEPTSAPDDAEDDSGETQTPTKKSGGKINLPLLIFNCGLIVAGLIIIIFYTKKEDK